MHDERPLDESFCPITPSLSSAHLCDDGLSSININHGAIHERDDSIEDNERGHMTHSTVPSPFWANH